ncbi:ABC transporter ATP-binding protein [Halococcus sediminicola]|uniref:ABC transporter ATP-binding protein n=1 Tax=Halococcus sediminicola TaxID=1264579 RepID=UPI0009AD7636|nr:ABC transporter ATP-binding protein [Halococcus sediminicola]
MMGHSSAPESVETTTNGAPILDIENVRVSYGKVQALKGVSLSMRAADILAVIGPNGAGKSTLADTIAGLLNYKGTVRFRGEEVRDRTVNRNVEDGLIYCTENRDLFDFMTVEQNLLIGAYRNYNARQERLEYVYELFPRLQERASQHAQTMSGGEQQMLAIGRALMGDPDLLVLDEPTLGLAPVIIDDISEALTDIVETGVSVLLLEQNVTFAVRYADHIHLLENGNVVRDGPPEDLQSDDYVREAYLGQ